MNDVLTALVILFGLAVVIAILVFVVNMVAAEL
jgi:hypothetical protein